MLRDGTQLQTLIDSLTAHVAVLDSRANIIMVNKAWLQFGLSNAYTDVDSNVGLNYLDVCAASAPEEPVAEDVWRALTSVLDGKLDSWSGEYRCDSPTEARWFQMSVKPLRMGDSLYVLVIHENISIHKQLELDHDEHLSIARILLSSIKERVVYHDAKRRIVWANRAAAVFAGTTRFALEVRQCPLSQGTGERSCMECAVSKAMASGKECEITKTFGDGTSHLVTAYPLFSPDGYLRGVVEVGLDITDQIKLQKELLEVRNAAEHAEQSRNHFLASVSHEIRTPMNIIVGMSDFLLKMRTEPETRDMLVMINNSAQSLLAIVNDLLDLTRIESGKLTLFREEFDPSSLIGECVQQFSLEAQGKGLQLDFEINGELPELCIGDPQRLQQVLVNLISNAVKYTDHGNVVVSASKVTHNDDHVQILFSVRDTGIGIRAEDLPRLFVPFTRLGDTSDAQRKGVGLGLNIVKRIVDLMGGQVWVESVPCVGSTFSFTLPLELPCTVVKEREEQTPALPTEPIGDITVLVVEDNRMNQRLASLLLERRGWRVALASNGQEALQYLAANEVDCILMDIQMPVLDGVATTREIRLREKGAGHRTPIIALTAHAMKGDRERYIFAGMDGYISKPMSVDVLYSTIESLVAQSRQRIANPENVEYRLVLDRFDGDKRLVDELIEILYQEYVRDREAVYAALLSEEYADAANLVHGIKGALANLGATESAQIAAQLEKSSRHGDGLSAMALLGKLELQVESLHTRAKGG